MEKTFGPFNGYVAVVRVREVSGFEGRFSASYKLWRCTPQADDGSARPVRQKSVGGVWESVEEAVDIALQLARLHIAGLPVRGHRPITQHVDATPSLTQLAKSCEPDPQSDFVNYQPTMACPLEQSVRT